MIKVKEPNIIYCKNNHIYDASLYDECPYCKKVAQGQSKLSQRIGIVANHSQSSQISIEDEDSTELLMDESNEDATELLDVEEDATELLIPQLDATAQKTKDAEESGEKQEVDNKDENPNKPIICGAKSILPISLFGEYFQ